MKIKLLNNGGYSVTKNSIGQIVEATPFHAGAKVAAHELQRVGCADADGDAYTYFPEEFEVVEE
jgi:hypothetical protein